MRVALLGSASALCTAERDNTAMVVEVKDALVLIDCTGSPAQKLLRLGFDYMRIDHILLTHWHPDHIYGLPSLLHEMHLRGRKRQLAISLPRSSQRIIEPFARSLFGEIDNLFEIEFHPLDMLENIHIFGGEGYAVYSTPVLHSDDTLAYKVVEGNRAHRDTPEKTFAYSSDTKPVESLVRLARRADLLVHECTYLDGEDAAVNTTHSTARQVGVLAAKAGVKKLGLVHLGVEVIKEPETAVNQVRENYSGEIIVGQDLMVFEV